MNLPLFQSMLRPVTRILVGLIAIPFFRFIMRRVFRLQDLNEELEKDLEQWFRGAVLLLAATANMEHLLFGWMSKVDWLDRADWLTMGLRLMLAIGVIEAMPDQEIFAVIHPGPPKLKPGRNVFLEIWRKKWAIAKGVICRHLNRSSPVLAMMCAIVGSNLPAAMETHDAVMNRSLMVAWAYAHQCSICVPADTMMTADVIGHVMPDATRAAADFQRHWERWLVGWTCYLLAITQYLIIGLVTSRDRAMDVLSEFDRAVAQRREELIVEFELQGKVASSPSPAPQSSVPSTPLVIPPPPDAPVIPPPPDAPAHAGIQPVPDSRSSRLRENDDGSRNDEGQALPPQA